MGLTSLKKMDGGYDVVSSNGEVLSHVSRSPDETWSYEPWVISGVYEKSRGGVNGAAVRRKGWPTLAAAVHEVEVMNSAAIARGTQ